MNDWDNSQNMVSLLLLSPERRPCQGSPVHILWTLMLFNSPKCKNICWQHLLWLSPLYIHSTGARMMQLSSQRNIPGCSLWFGLPVLSRSKNRPLLFSRIHSSNSPLCLAKGGQTIWILQECSVSLLDKVQKYLSRCYLLNMYKSHGIKSGLIH